MRRRVFAIVLNAFILTISTFMFTCHVRAQDEVNPATGELTLARTIEHLSKLGSRVPGYEGNIKAASYIETAFTQLGLKELRKEEFFVSVPVDKGASLKTPDGKEVTLYCLWPNMVRTPTLPRKGVRGKLIYAGGGEYRDYNGKELKGTVVLLDFNCGMNWIKAAELGAAAVIFIEPEETGRIEAERKFVEVPINVPRFMVAREDLKVLEKIQGQNVTLKAEMQWQKVPAWNILGLIPGKDEKLSGELIALSAYYDSISVAPMVAPGAESACGVAALIEVAKDLTQNPPARPVLFIATSAHFMGLRGIDAFIQRHCRNIAPFKRRITEPINIKLFIGLDLSSDNDEFGISHQGSFFNIDEFYYQRLFAPFGQKFEDYAAELCKELSLGNPEDIFVNGTSPKKGISWSSYVPDNIALDSEVPMLAGIPAFSLVTVNDNRNRVDTPIDTADKVNMENLAKQLVLLKPLIRRALNDRQLFPESQMELKDGLCTLEGRIVTFNPRKSFVPDDPVSGAIAFIRRTCPCLMGVKGSFYEMTSDRGEFVMSLFGGGKYELEAYGTNPENGEINLAPDRGVNGDQSYPILFIVDWKLKKHMVVLFECVPTDLYDLVDPRYLTKLSQINVFDATNSTPFAYGYSVDEVLGARPMRTSDVCPYGVVFSEAGNKLKVGLSSSVLGLRVLLLNSPAADERERAEGIGYDVDVTRKITEPSFLAAKDMLNLNEFRVKELARYGIVNNRLDELHTRAKEALENAEKARKGKNWEEFMKYSRRALGIESRAYPDVKATANDVIKGVIFYMALLIPFAFFTERLVLGGSDIKKQIMGSSGIFLAIYVIMRFVHPAFRIATAPEVILLAFIVLTLSVVVLGIVSSKFQEQMEKMKQKRAKVYQADVGRISASATAFSLGISNMKRRKIRTLLTCTTLILLTFTVLSFTSVKTFMQFNQIPRSNRPSYQGALIRDRVWYPLEQPALDYIESEFSEEAVVSPRAWIISREVGRSHRIKLKVLEERGKSCFAMGALGLSPKEKDVTHPEKYLTAGDWFSDDDLKVCILPSELAQLLGINSGDVGKKKIHMLGEILSVKGIFDSQAMKDFNDLDDERITPVDFMVMSPLEQQQLKEKKQTTASMQGKTKIESFTHLELSSVVLVPFSFARNMGGTIQSVAVRFHEGVDIREKVENFVARLAVTVFAGIEDRVTVYSSLAMTSFSGMSNLFIPILIASLIVLNTMMGSVYERFKEIGIYSSVGLAPVHIAALFMAESCVFAILGAIAGYLIGQVMARIFTAVGALAGLTLNYSSLSAVSSTMVVMTVVLLSTIYPARKAAQMAVPDVTRRWVLPNPEGDIWKFEFPFTVSGREILGLYTFFKEYFSSYEDESIGNFYTQETKLSKFRHRDEDGFMIDFKNWLAPFDLGVSQEVEMRAVPTGEYGVYEIHLEIRRLSGETNNWVRLNRRFLDIIRKQFLIWRTVSLEVKAEYREQGEKLFNLPADSNNRP